jgi:hypothetical protein
LAWDFGVLSMRGVETHVLMRDLVVAGAAGQHATACCKAGPRGRVAPGQRPPLCLHHSSSPTICKPATHWYPFHVPGSRAL